MDGRDQPGHALSADIRRNADAQDVGDPVRLPLPCEYWRATEAGLDEMAEGGIRNRIDPAPGV